MAVGMLAGYELQKNINWQNRFQGDGGGSSSLQQVMDLVDLKYVDSLKLDSIEADGIEAIVDQLDPKILKNPRCRTNPFVWLYNLKY